MKKILKWSLLTACMVCSACSQNHIEEVKQPSQKQYSLRPRVRLIDSWETQTRQIGQTDPIAMFYLFDSNPSSKCIMNRGDALNSPRQVLFNDVKQPGEYTIYGVTGWFKDDFPGVTKNDIYRESTQMSFLPKLEAVPKAARDICLGKTTFTINPLQLTYDVVVQVDHIMAKAAFTIKNVPAAVNSITVTLPNQATNFTLEGVISGNTNSQSLQLTKGSVANADGTYNWELKESLVYPFAQDTGEMPIDIVATQTGQPELSFKTKSTQPCSSGKRVNYTSDWKSIIYAQNIQLQYKDWTTTIIQNEFPLVEPPKK